MQEKRCLASYKQLVLGIEYESKKNSFCDVLYFKTSRVKNLEDVVKAVHLEYYGAIIQILFQAQLCRATTVIFLKM